MASVLEFDEEMSRRVEAIYKTEDAARRRRAVLEALAPSGGEGIVDIGTGPGFLALEIAGRVGPTGEVLGVDVSGPMLQLARTRCASIPQVRFETADATKLPVLDASFDVAASVWLCHRRRLARLAVRELTSGNHQGEETVPRYPLSRLRCSWSQLHLSRCARLVC